MSNVSRGLFDPRRRMQHWPEPNDDPNIPYAWGEGGLGYAISGYRQNEGETVAIQPLPSETVDALVNRSKEIEDSSKTQQQSATEAHKALEDLAEDLAEDVQVDSSTSVLVKPVDLNSQPKAPINETVVSVAIASSMVLGVWGLLDGYSQSQNTGGERVFDSLEKAVIYATGIGFIASKLRKG